MNRMSPKVGHVALTIFAEAYSVGVDVLLRHPENGTIDEDTFIDRCMSFGKQAYLQRRISSEASVEKLLYANAWKMLMVADSLMTWKVVSNIRGAESAD